MDRFLQRTLKSGNEKLVAIPLCQVTCAAMLPFVHFMKMSNRQLHHSRSLRIPGLGALQSAPFLLVPLGSMISVIYNCNFFFANSFSAIHHDEAAL